MEYFLKGPELRGKILKKIKELAHENSLLEEEKQKADYVFDEVSNNYICNQISKNNKVIGILQELISG